MTTVAQAMYQADLLIEYLHDDRPEMKEKPVGDVNGWAGEPIFDGRATKWTNPARGGWEIFEQPAAFYVWHGFTFAGEDETFESAVARVERA